MENRPITKYDFIISILIFINITISLLSYLNQTILGFLLS